MTFTLDDATVDRIDRTAMRLGKPKSAVIREAVAEYAARVGRLSDEDRVRLLDVFDAVVGKIPRRSAEAVDRELAEVRRARNTGGRGGRASTK